MLTVTDYAGRETAYEYDANGMLLKTFYPNGAEETITHNEKGQILESTTRKGDEIIAQKVYTYDKNGNIRTENDDRIRMQAAYDRNDQLISAAELWYTGKEDSTHYQYDDGGNMLTENITSQGSGAESSQTDMGYQAGNQMQTWNGQTLSFDLDGNMTRGPLNGSLEDYQYNALNQLMQAGNTQYVYDGEGKRVQSIYGEKEVTYIVDPISELSQVLVTRQDDGTVTYYVYGNGLISQETFRSNANGAGDADENDNILENDNGIENADVLIENDNETLSRNADENTAGESEYRIFHFDYRGSTITMTNENGTVTDRITYNPYGTITSREGDTETIFLYVGKYGVQTDDNGLIHMRARYYNPEMKRFVNEDPIKDGLNWYVYAGNNPLNWVDITGLSTDKALEILQEAVKIWMSVEGSVNGSSFLTPKPPVKVYALPCTASGVHKDALSAEQIEANVKYIYQYLSTPENGWSKQAIAALLGNMQQESGINPGSWQNWHKKDKNTDGYGLVQWSPGKNFLGDMDPEDVDSWAINNPKSLMDAQLEHLLTTMKPNGGAWYPSMAERYYKVRPLVYDTPEKMTYEEFISSTNDSRDLALVFHATYERSGDNKETLEKRAKYAKHWFEYLEHIYPS